MEYIFDRNKLDELLKKLKDDDIVKITGGDLINLLNKSSDVPKGRKPIAVDIALFNETVSMWQSGKITARQAMEKLDLKPNTFYRRIKERGLTDMKDIKSEIKGIIEENKQELSDLRKQVKDDAKTIKAKVDEDLENAVSARHMENDILREKVAAEIDYKLSERELRAEVEKEKKNLKK